MPFQWNDPLLFDEQLSKDERAWRDKTADFAATTLAPRVLTDFRDEAFDPAIMRAFGKAHLLGANIKGYDCAGVNQVTYGLIMREIERIDSGYRSIMSIQSSLAMFAIHTFGSEEQKEKYLPAMAKGELIGCFGLTEPEHGSDPANMDTHTKKNKDKFIMNGIKKWISNATIADVFIIWAKDDNHHIQAYLLEKNMPGLSTSLIKGKLSLRVALTGEITLDNVVITDKNVLPKAQGLKSALRCLDSARYGIAWGALGAAESCWHIARNYVLNRKQFDRPLAANQLIQLKLANMQTAISLGLQGCLRLGKLKDENKIEPPMISMMKRFSTLTALDIAREARDMLGANGILDEHHVMRHMVNLETVKTYEGTADIHALILGREQTGIQAFRS